MYSTEMDLNSDEFVNKLRIAYYSVLYDHPNCSGYITISMLR